MPEAGNPQRNIKSPAPAAKPPFKSIAVSDTERRVKNGEFRDGKPSVPMLRPPGKDQGSRHADRTEPQPMAERMPMQSKDVNGIQQSCRHKKRRLGERRQNTRDESRRPGSPSCRL